MAYRSCFRRRAALLALACSLALPAAAQSTRTDASPFSFDVSAGYRYSSRLAIPDLDIRSDSGDSAFVVKGGIDFDTRLAERTRFNAGYSYSGSRYADFEAFDTDVHVATVGIKHDFRVVDTGLAYHHAQSSLDGRDYLDYNRASAFVSRDLGDQAMIRGSLTHTDKDYGQAPGRDATVRAGGADLFWFLRGRRTYLTLGYEHERNDARADEFDFDANHFNIGFSHAFALLGRDSRLRLNYKHEDRDYDSVTPSIGRVRDDTRTSFDTELKMDVTRHVYASLEHEIKDNASNLPVADISRNITTLRIGMQF